VISGGGARTRSEEGYSLVALIGSITIMFILMAAATPTWRYIMKNDREEELLFRGGEIADAIVRFQKKNANAYPTSLDQLVKGRFLRRLYKDPMSADGKWRLVHQGQAPVPGANPGGAGPGGTPTPPTTRPASTGGLSGTTLGPILGVSSTSTEKSLRIFNGRTQYHEWIFAAGQPRVIGRPVTIGAGGGLPGGPGGGNKGGTKPPVPK
jgi:type II secretory pathway pseudopilin PulG